MATNVARSSAPATLVELLLVADLDKDTLFAEPLFGLKGCSDILTDVLVRHLRIDKLRLEDAHRVRDFVSMIFVLGSGFISILESREPDDKWLSKITTNYPWELVHPKAIRAVIDTLILSRQIKTQTSLENRKANTKFGKDIEKFRGALTRHKKHYKNHKSSRFNRHKVPGHWEAVAKLEESDSDDKEPLYRWEDYHHKLRPSKMNSILLFLEFPKPSRASIKNLPKEVLVYLRAQSNKAANPVVDTPEELKKKYQKAREFLDFKEQLAVPEGWIEKEWHDWVHQEIRCYLDPTGELPMPTMASGDTNGQS